MAENRQMSRTRLEIPLRNEDPSSLLQDQVVQDTGGGGGDGLQIVEVRGGCQWPVTSTHQAQNRRQSPERDDDPAKPRIVRAEVGGGEDSGDKQKVTKASTGGGEISGSDQEDECMEIKVVWGGTTKNPVPIVSHPRPRRSDSPPLPRRSWMATPIGRKIQLGSSTLQQVRTTPINHTSRVPATINIPTNSLGVPGGSNMYPMDLSKRSPPPLIPIEGWPACPSPSRSQGSFEGPPTHGIAQILKAAYAIEKARRAAQDAMMNNVEDEVLVNAPAIRENDKDIGVETIPTTRNGLWSPANDVMWGDSPPLVIDLEATPITDPESTMPLTMTSTSMRGTSPSRAVLRVAKWVGELGDNSANHQEMDDMPDRNQEIVTTEGDSMVQNGTDGWTMNKEVQGEKIDPVRGSTDSRVGVKPRLSPDVREVENEDTQARHRGSGDEVMWVDEGETVATSEVSAREEVEEELDVGGPETVSQEIPGLIHEASTGEYVEPVDQKEMLRALFEDPQPETRNLTNLEVKPVFIPQWPRHIASHLGQVEDSEVLSDRANSPIDQSPSVESILESIWIDVVPKGGVTEVNHLMIIDDPEPQTETPSNLTDEIISDEEIAMAIDRDSEERGGGEKVLDVGEEDEEGGMEVARLKDAYVSLRKMKIRISKQKRKRRASKWMFEKDLEDRDWKPPQWLNPGSRRKKMKAPPRIKLIRTRPISEDEEQTEPSEGRPRRRRIWRGTNYRHQSEVITFYQTLHKRRIKEGKKRQRRRRREEEQGVYGGFVTIEVPVTAGRSPNSGRPHWPRKSDSGAWEAELRGGLANGTGQGEGLEVDLETTQDEEQEVCHMEERRLDQDTVGGDAEVAVEQDLEEKSGTKRIPSTKEEIGPRKDEGAQEEDVSEGGYPKRESRAAEEGEGEGECPKRESRAAEEGEIVEEAETDDATRPSTAPNTAQVNNPSAPIIGVQDLLRKWAEDGVHGIACEVRVRSAETPPPRPLDQEVSRGKSMR